TPEQTKRLKQIELQQRGADGLLQKDVEKALNLTDEQKEKIKTITEDARKEMQSLRPAPGAGRPGGGGGAGGPPQEFFKKMAMVRKETQDKAMAVLTAEQVKTYKELTGAPFEMKFEPRQGRGQGKGKA